MGLTSSEIHKSVSNKYQGNVMFLFFPVTTKRRTCVNFTTSCLQLQKGKKGAMIFIAQQISNIGKLEKEL